MIDALPVRVGLHDAVELERRGLDEMLRPYADRVQLLRDADWNPAPDLHLYDPFAPRSPGRVTRQGRWVVWTWHTERRLDPAEPVQPLGYLDKRLPACELVADLEKIHHGEFVVDRVTPFLDPEQWLGQREGLTPRQGDVMVGLADGLTNRQLAVRLGVSLNTAKSYIRGAYQKAGVTTRPQALLWAIAHDLRTAPRDAAVPQSDDAEPAPR